MPLWKHPGQCFAKRPLDGARAQTKCYCQWVKTMTNVICQLTVSVSSDNLQFRLNTFSTHPPFYCLLGFVELHSASIWGTNWIDGLHFSIFSLLYRYHCYRCFPFQFIDFSCFQFMFEFPAVSQHLRQCILFILLVIF